MPKDGASITETLEGIAQGRFVEEVTDRLRELTKEMTRIAESGGGKPKAKISITLSFLLDRGIFELEPSYKVTEPATVRARTILYADPVTGALSKSDHRVLDARQLEIAPVREVASDQPIRDVRDIRERQANTNV